MMQLIAFHVIVVNLVIRKMIFFCLQLTLFRHFLNFSQYLQERFWASDNDFSSIWKWKRIYFTIHHRRTSVTVRLSIKTAYDIPCPWTYWIRGLANFKWAKYVKTLRRAVNRLVIWTSIPLTKWSVNPNNMLPIPSSDCILTMHVVRLVCYHGN